MLLEDVNGFNHIINRLKMDFVFRLFFTVLIFSSYTKLNAQKNELKFISNLTAEDGLSLNVVTEVLQDSRGFLWFGTYNGLNRYDGYNFKVFLPEPSNSKSISNHSIWDIFEDSQGYIWVGTLEGLNRYNYKTEEFRRYINDPDDDNSLSNNYVTSIYEDMSGTLWIGTINGLNKYNREKDNFTVFKKVSKGFNVNSYNSVTCIEEDKEGNLWLGTWEGLTCMRKDGSFIYKTLPEFEKTTSFIYNQISVILEDNFNSLWIGTTGGLGLYKYDLETEDFVNYTNIPGNTKSISNNNINVIYADKSNCLWVGTQTGMDKFDYNTNKFIRLTHDPQGFSTVINNRVYSILEDKTGLYWIGTSEGVSRAYKQTNTFNLFQNKNADGSSVSPVNYIYIDRNGNIWTCTRDGLNKTRIHNNKIIYDERLRINKNDNDVRSIVEDRSGIVWVGTNGGGLSSYNPKTGKIKVYKYDLNDDETISNNGVISLCVDRNDNIWAGTWWGLNLLDKQTGKFEKFTNFKNNLCWVIYEDSKGMLWIGTDGGGVNELNPETKTFTNYIDDSSSTKVISGGRVISIFESHNGLMWFGTTNGLNSYDRKTGKITVYNKDNGLSSNIINSINEDDTGSLWISTDREINKLKLYQDSFNNYNKRDGLIEINFAANATAKSKKGTLFFAGNKGVVFFNPDSIKDNFLQANVVFTDLKIYNQTVPISKAGNSILTESITGAKTINIPYSFDVITLEFALLDYFDVKKNKFMYKLEGFDKVWNDVGPRNSATYTNLSPDEYMFRVKASHREGFKNAEETLLQVIIVPSYYQTWWFRIASGTALLIIIFFFFNVRTRSIHKRNKILENKVIERTKDLDKTIENLNIEIASKDKFFSIIAHDLRSPFTSLLGFSEYMVRELDNLPKDELKLIAKSIEKSASLTYGLLENLLQWARIQTGRIDFNPEEINMKKILYKTAELYKANAESKNISVNINVDDNLIVYADLNMIETVLRNFISNSIKFTENGGNINFSAKDNKGYVQFSIADSGVGISQETIDRLFKVGHNVSTLGTQNEKGSGLGLILCKEFIEFNKGKISVKSKLGEGSEFSFMLPKENVYCLR